MSGLGQRTRPAGLSPKDDWIDVTSQEYRTWVAPQPGRTKRIMFGRLPDGLPYGNYTIRLTRNAWPADLWHATKSIVLAQVTVLGSRRRIVSVLFFIWGALLLFASGLFFVGLRLGWRAHTQSSAEVPMERIETVLRHQKAKYAQAHQSLERLATQHRGGFG